MDSTWHKFFKSTRALLHESYPDKVIPGLGKIRKTFMLYCTRYIKKAKGMDYHNCPVCLPVKVNFPRIMKLLSKAHREHCTNSRCIFAKNPSLLSNTYCFYFVRWLLHNDKTRIGVPWSCAHGKCEHESPCSITEMLSQSHCQGFQSLLKQTTSSNIFSIERVEVEAGNAAQSKFTTLMHKETPYRFSEAIVHVNSLITKFVPHHYRRHWQRNQEHLLYSHMKTNPRYAGVLVSISDFAMAITVEFKFAIQSQ